MEELKREMVNKVFYRDEMPEDIMKVIQEAFEGIENKYRELDCDNLAIQEYIAGSLKEAKSYITSDLGKRRKENQMERIQEVIRKMEKEFEEIEIPLEERKRNQESNKNDMNQIGSEDDMLAVRTMEILEDLLRDVQFRQNRILDANNFSIDKIGTIQQEVYGFIKGFVSRNEEKIREILGKDNEELKEQLLSEYEQYLLQSGKEEEEKEAEQTNKSRRDEFVEGLDGGISLEEQRVFSEKKITEKDKESEQKRAEQRGSIEELPESTLE